MAEKYPLPFEYTGFSLPRDIKGDVATDQNHYLRKLGYILTDSLLNLF